MPLLRTYDAGRGTVASSPLDGYRDRLGRWSDIQEYLPFLYEQVASRPGCRVLELGTRKGNSTLAFLAAAEVCDGHVWSSDISPVTRDPEGMRPWRDTPRWTFLQGDDTDPAVQTLLPARCDVLFIDTSHEYEHTLAELREYVPRVAPGGIALFHDTNLKYWPGYEWHRDVSPVWAALDEYCDETGLSWENLPGEYGMGCIRL